MAKVLERMVAIPLDAEGRALEGVYLTGSEGCDAGAVVAPPHPLYGGSMDSPVVNEVSYACRQGGLAALRFNWRGVGASTGQPSSEAADADADYAAATEQLAETVSGPLVAAGYSFGAAAAARMVEREPRIHRAILVAPPVAMLDPRPLEKLAGVLVVTGQHDDFAPPAALEECLDGLVNTKLHVVPRADHFFMAGLADIARAIEDWL